MRRARGPGSRCRDLGGLGASIVLRASWAGSGATEVQAVDAGGKDPSGGVDAKSFGSGRWGLIAEIQAAFDAIQTGFSSRRSPASPRARKEGGSPSTKFTLAKGSGTNPSQLRSCFVVRRHMRRGDRQRSTAPTIRRLLQLARGPRGPSGVKAMSLLYWLAQQSACLARRRARWSAGGVDAEVANARALSAVAALAHITKCGGAVG